MTVYEKTKSIGIMKAQGASRKHINVMFLVQAGVLGLLGGIVGSILAVIASFSLDKFVIAQLKSKGENTIEKLFYTPLWAILMAIGFSILVCLIAGILPARRAAKLNPVDSLRYE
jgi:putative ABC transport system permease protein